jgi:predicted outer membrane repeat protein
VGGAVNAIIAVIGATAFGNNSAYVNGAAVEAARGAVCGVPDADLHGGVGCSMSYQAQAGATRFVAQTGTADVLGGTSCALPNFVGVTDAAIQDAIEVASDGDTIVICPGTYDIGTTLNLGVKPLTLQGAGSAMTILDGGNTIGATGSNDDGHQIMISSANITLNGLTLQNGFISGSGGAISTSGDVLASSCLFDQNVVALDVIGNSNGGAINAGNVSLDASVFTNNHAELFGGAVSGSAITSRISVFFSNIATQKGGAINGGASVFASTFEHNHSNQSGGAIYGSGLFCNCNHRIICQ